MKKGIELNLLFILMLVASNAQKQFNKVVYKQPGTLIYHSNFNAIKTNTGGYAITEANGSNAYVGVFDSSFNVQWSRNINIDNTHKSAGLAIAQSTLDSSFCMIGATYDPSRPEYDLLISKMSKRGKELGTASVLYGTSSGGNCRILPLPQGKFLIGVDGNSAGTIGLIVMNAKGKLSIIKNVSYGNYSLLFEDLIPTKDGGFMLTGNIMYSFGTGQRDIFCCKLDNQLNIQWTKSYATGMPEEITGIIQTNEGGYFMYGYQYISATTNSRFVKLDVNGNVQWNRLIHLSSNSTPVSAVQTSDGGYVLTGIELYKLSRKGNFQWISRQAFSNFAYPVFETKDHGLVTFSQLDGSQFNIIKTDSSGNTCNASYDRTYTLLNDNLTVQSASFTLSNGSVQQINTGHVFTDAGNSSYMLCQSTEPAIQNDQQNYVVAKQSSNQPILLYSNPAKDRLAISLHADKISRSQIIVTGEAGNTILSQDIQNKAGKNLHQLNVAALKPGIYFLTIICSEGKTTMKFVKE